MYLVVTGTPEFFEGYHGLQALAPLADRVATRFSEDPRYDNLRAPQVRLHPFDAERLEEVGTKVRELYPARHQERVRERVNDAFMSALVERTTTAFGGEVSVVPRLFLRELVDVMDRVDQHRDFDPVSAYDLKISDDKLSPEELSAKLGKSVEEIEGADVDPAQDPAPGPAQDPALGEDGDRPVAKRL
jgi:hypothetical protein